eukprot:CAMPEP_0181318406 /NCGR_PEP_ID=MMETSP1101-20121128/16988_1 /TAXON_ID=46948 /ORGANISM="Rhodomonas abbreviata, Strain Caron Lab Isolate" /LENGTH=130 /DNA_ID=CAMNT_0023425871 /DNA_START=23 /DNA_END=415 /DNA_ORIENTATION=-
MSHRMTRFSKCRRRRRKEEDVEFELCVLFAFVCLVFFSSAVLGLFGLLSPCWMRCARNLSTSCFLVKHPVTSGFAQNVMHSISIPNPRFDLDVIALAEEDDDEEEEEEFSREFCTMASMPCFNSLSLSAT